MWPVASELDGSADGALGGFLQHVPQLLLSLPLAFSILA